MFTLRNTAFNSSNRGLDTFSQAALSNLLVINQLLESTASPFGIASEVLTEHLNQWMCDPQHGVEHSYQVFNTMQNVRDAENISVNDDELFIRAVLHDFAEFIPFQRDGKKISQEERTIKHTKYIRYLIKSVAKLLNLEDTTQLAVDIFHHDDFYYKPTQDGIKSLSQIISPAGKILADADRLVLDAKGSIARNRVGSLGRWYFFRQDLGEERSKWEPRTKGLFDGFSALALEFLSPDWCLYTDYAKKLYQERVVNFEEELYKFYEKTYVEGWQILGQAKQSDWKIRFGLKDQAGITEIPFKQRQDLRFDQLNLVEQIKQLLHIPVLSKSTEIRKYYGYSIQVIDPEGKIYWLDPSIIIFKNEEEMKRTFKEAILNFTPIQ